MTTSTTRAFLVLAMLCAAAPVHAQLPPGVAPPTLTNPVPILIKPTVKPLGPNRFQVGPIEVNTATREISVPGQVNDATILEFVANTLGGFKAYESALTVNTNAITFNTALILIGLDKRGVRVPQFHFDPEPPQGPPIDMWVEWTAGSATRRVRVEQLLLDKRTNTTMDEGPWVYTGSSFLPHGAFWAESDGVLIGFVHSPAPIIENPRKGAVSAYGAVVFNEQLGLKPGTPVTLIVKAIGPRP